ncbi:MAG: hypothetical protein ACE5GS_01205 [Kiloniellaceae bacterium]
MAGKKVWLTWMPGGEGAPQPQDTVATLGRYGLEASGAQWTDDLEKVAWAELGGVLLDRANADLWVLAGRRGDLESPRNRYALSLVTAMVRDGRGGDLRGVCLGLDFAPEAAGMPFLLRSFQLLDGRDGGWPAALVAAAYGAPAPAVHDFRLNVIAHSLVGQWFEVGPREGEWQGVMLGASAEGTITHHAVGPRGQLPEKAVLEYPVQGIEAQIGADKFLAWAVQNRLGPEDSYYVRIEGYPTKLIFGGHPGTDQAEVVVLDLV